jgi:lysozyme
MPAFYDGIIDLSHHNTVTDFGKVSEAVTSVIHKCSQGLKYADPTYTSRREAARAAGLLWGAYHFGDGSDGVAQAQFFLSKVKPNEDLLVLDFEANPAGPSMPLVEAHAFVTTIFNETGRYPGLYAGHYLKQLLGSSGDSLLANCWLWIAQYSDHATVPPGWSSFTFWQYTDGAAGPNPKAVPGVGLCDRDIFNGEAANVTGDAVGLTQFWTQQLGI